MDAKILFSSFDTQSILARFGKKLPGAGLLGKTLLKHPKKLGDLALPFAKKIIKDRGFDMELNSITVDAEDAAVKSVTVGFGKINYAQVGVAALPLAQKLLHKKITPQDVQDALEKVDLPGSEAFAKAKEAAAAESDVPAMIRAAVGAVSDAEKPELAKQFLAAYQEKLCEKGNSLLQKKHLAATVSAVDIN